MADEIYEDVMNSLIGRTILEWSMGDDGLHFRMSDGRIAIFGGAFYIAVVDEKTVH